MRNRMLAGVALLPVVAALAQGGLFDWGWEARFAENGAWRAHPTWLTDASAGASLSVTGGVACFAVPEANRGMKWYLPVSPSAIVSQTPWMVVSYCASTNFNVNASGYFIYLDDSKPGERSALKRKDVKADGQWHEVAVCIDKLVLSKTLKGIAVHVQSGKAGGSRVQFGHVRLCERPPESAEGVLPQPLPRKVWAGALPNPDFTGYQTLPVPAGAASLKDVLNAMRGVGWPELDEARVDDVPFRLPKPDTRLPVSGILQTGTLEVPVVGCRASEVSVLLCALLRGSEEEVYQRDRAIEGISQTDRFSVRVEYADGSSEEAFPYNASTREFDLRDGLQVVNLFTDPGKPITRLLFFDKTDRAAIALLALSARIGERAFGAFSEEAWPAERYRAAERKQGPVRFEVADGALRFGPWPSGCLDIRSLPRWKELKDLSGRPVMAGDKPWLYTVRLSGTNVPPERFKLERALAEAGGCYLEYSVAGREGLALAVKITPELGFLATLRNSGDAARKVEVTGPEVGPVALGAAAEDYYVYPNAGWAYHSRTVKLEARYGGRFPLQFMGVFSASAGSGMWLATQSTEGGLWDYGMEKKADGTRFWLKYPERDLPAGGTFTTTLTGLSFGGCDWHAAFDAYKKWAATWRTPKYPRQLWFREVFNFRQKFLHRYDPLFDPATKTFSLQQAITEGEELFGGIDYLHLFDWGDVPGYGRLYGRVGDLSPYESLGGAENFHQAIQAVRAKGVPVGLYIEGYLVAEKGRIGQEHGKEWQIMQRSGELMYYQPGSTEMMMCPWLEAWRATQAETYRQKVRELEVDGMYMDQFGFTNPQKDCWSPVHGHPVPGSTLLAEKELADRIHGAIAGVRPGVVTYGEEIPCDVAAPYQDGSFAYHLQRCRTSKPWAPLDLMRFADPTFKVFQLLVCDRPTGSWAEGVRWTFFTGDGLWIEGPPEWFAPETRAAIRRCHGILRANKDAFCSENVTPLVETMAGGIYANRFVAPGRTVYTLYNARHREYRGAVLELPARAGARYFDAWRGEALRPRVAADGRAVVEMTVGPRGVSCLVVTIEPNAGALPEREN